MKPKEFIKKIQRDGWELDRVHGSHHIFRKDKLTISVPFHNKDMKPGLLNNLLKKTGLK